MRSVCLRRFPLLGATALALALTASALTAGASEADSVYDAALNGIASTGLQALRAYMHSSSPSDPRYYTNGVWYATDGPPCWYCYDSAAVGAATLSQQPGGDASLRRVAIDTFNTAIAKHQLSNGAFAFNDGSADGIGTGFFTVDLGVSYLELRKVLDVRTRARWRGAVEKAADYLIDSGNATWYINGNVNLRQTEVFWLAWSITRLPRFLRAYDAEWSFTIAPPQKRWPGFGLHITKMPTRSDGANGAAYLAESGGGAPGFDPSYTDAQLDGATDLYVLTREPRYLRLMNLLFGQLRPLINSAWTLNATGGTRESYYTPFMDPAVSILASGVDPGLKATLGAQISRISSQYLGAETFTNVNYFKGFESWISMPLLNRQWPKGMAPAIDVRTHSAPASKSHSGAGKRH